MTHPTSAKSAGGPGPEAIAIVGMACRLPGGDGLDEYWETIRTGRSTIEVMPPDRLDRDLYFDETRGSRGKTYSDIGGCVAPRELDWSLLNVLQHDAQNWDECHLNFYEVAARACRDANCDPRDMPNRNAGVFVGHSGGTTLGGELAFGSIAPEYRDLLSQHLGSEKLADQVIADLVAGRPQRGAGKPMVDAGFASGLVSHAMGLSGPHMSIDAACASSLVALQLGALALNTGQVDMAIVGGASFNKSDSLVLFSHARSCSASGSRPFDDSADGLVGSEGYVALVLKTLGRAHADGDRVHAVIRGIGMASDGRGKSLWAPRKEGQQEAIRRAYVNGVPPESVQMIEAHATSTQVGDATELKALGDFYKQHLPSGRKLPVGSVKSNLGHTLETAGLAGVLKAVLSIQNGIIPATINVEQLNTSVDWSELPLVVNRTPEAWPELPPNHPRRAAVNAFGIGGLNVHVVVEGAAEDPKPRQEGQNHAAPSQRRLADPIALIGRGVVLPGVNDLPSLKRLLVDGDRQLSCESGNRMSEHPAGYVHAFEYDWRKHRIPPKQIAQANPLQFMLLDAAEQALEDAGLLAADFDRKRTAVVVGSPFGGDFGNELFAGLRLPELRDKAERLLRQRGMAEDEQQILLDELEDAFLKQYPALLDETGSFTSSTLASRLAKTFDLMGGAMAIDSGDASGAAALDVASQLLDSGSADYVLCAVAHRALDAASIENLRQLGRLPTDQDSFLVGEGVALVVLTRHSDAQRIGSPVHAVIHEREARMGRLGGEPIDYAASPLFNSTGYLQATQSIVDLICTTIRGDGNEKQIHASTASGLGYTLYIGEPKSDGGSNTKTQTATTAGAVPTADVETFVATSREQLAGKLTQFVNGAVAAKTSSAKAGDAVAVVSAVDIEKRQSVARRLASKLSKANCPPQGFDQGAVWQIARTRKPTVAWLFPGQGSQSTGMLKSLVACSDAAKSALSEANDQLSLLGEPSFEQIAWDTPNQLGVNIWHTQASMLVADWLAMQALRELGLQCDYVCGHSYGEIPAMLAAGCWDLATALRVTKLRCAAIGTVSTELRLVSVFAFDDQIAKLLAEFGGKSLQVSHRNAPQQFVVGGIRQEVETFATSLDSQNVMNKVLAVPTAFHTEHLRAAVPVFQRSLDGIKILPPKLPLLSSVHNTFVSEPATLRRQLADQLVTQLDFVEATHRLKEVGVTHAVEVGPQQVLSKLVGGTAKGWVILPLDSRSDQGAHWNAFKAGTELFGLQQSFEMQPQPGIAQNKTMAKVCPSDVLRFDATQARRDRLRQSSRHAGVSAQTLPPKKQPALQYDATEARRAKNRGQVSALSEKTDAPAIASMPARAESQGGSSDSVAQFLIDLIVEQTGYPAEIIELDWAFEADLGIDSIKKAQIFGELREYIDVEANSALRLDDFVTLRDVVGLLERSPGKSDWLDDSPPAEANGLAEPSTKDVSVSPGGEAGELAELLIDFVVEQTGFPREMVSLDADLESDLGIDSIKKAQLLGEVSEILGGSNASDSAELSPTLRTLDELRSLGDILSLLRSRGTSDRGHASSQPCIESVEPPETHAVSRSIADNTLESRTDNGLALSGSELSEFLIDFVIDQTGYPREIVELDADLEADLGIDSIKKAQMLGEVQEALAVDLTEASSGSKLSLDGLRTLWDIIRLASPGESVSPSTAIAETQQTQPPIDQVSCASLPAAEQIVTPSLRAFGAGREIDTGDSVPVRTFEANNDVDYLQAVKRNMRCFVARNTGDNLPVRPSGAIEASQRLATDELASRVCVPSVALQAMGQTLEASVFWSPCCELDDEENTWESSLHVPAWLADRGTPVALELDRASGCILVITPGSMTPLACISGAMEAIVVEGQGGKRPSSRQLVEALTDDSAGEFPGVHVRRIGGRDSAWQQNKTLATSRDKSIPAGYVRVARIGCERSTGRIALQDLGCPYAGPKDVAIPVAPTEQSATQTSLAAPSTPALPETATTDDIASRFVLRMAPSRLPDVVGRLPTWSGGAVVVGDNPVARQLEARLKSSGVSTIRLQSTHDEFGLRDVFKRFAANQSAPHLFLASAWDSAAELTLDSVWWAERKESGLLANFWLTQAWLEHIVESDSVDGASLIQVSSMGGDFGISGNSYSVEGGGLGGLLKSVLIETWMQGHRCLPIKTLDTSRDQSPAEIVDCIWRELAIPSYDNEVSYAGGVRQVVRAIRRPIEESALDSSALPNGGSWVCTGGARGITAFVAEQLATRFGLTVHLLGTTSLDGFDANWRDLDSQALGQLKKQVLMQARDRGVSPVKAWQDTEKVLEIDATIRRMRESGIDVHYHVCDCSDFAQVEATLAKVRQISGAITGILHGAGVGKDSRFERKQPEKVRQCISAKVDGALALMEATRDDPLEYFVGFGSISGRFGANGHTDYSLANEMLCKQVAWFRRQRPKVKATAFHWHAWGDVGMATKPETRLALEMIDMQFMPAEEGAEHLIRELAAGAPEGEVLVTDDRYYRMFYPAESILGEAATTTSGPALLNKTIDSGLFACDVDPQRDPFLVDHVLDGRPLLPMVVAAELLAEAAEKAAGQPCGQLCDVEAISALRFFSDKPQEIYARVESNGGSLNCAVESKFIGRSGHASDQQRVNFRCRVPKASRFVEPELVKSALPGSSDWERAIYPPADAKFYVGWPFQKLRRVIVAADGLVGQIAAPALVELAGGGRDTSAWRIPSAAMDACLFAVGIYAWQKIRPGISLPVGIGRLTLGRLPRPGEACQVHVRPRETSHDNATFDFSLYGVDRGLIIHAENYKIAWLAGGLEQQTSTAQVASHVQGN